jgi:predicted RNase H-like HicB family nuclease
MQLTAEVHHEDGAYWAEISELPGCFAAGDTPAELIESLEEAAMLYLDKDSPPVLKARFDSAN